MGRDILMKTKTKDFIDTGELVMAKKKNNKKKSVNKTSTKVNVEVKNSDSKLKLFFEKKPARIALHVVTALVWIAFLADFFTFQYNAGEYPNVILSVLALVTFALEWNIKNKK